MFRAAREKTSTVLLVLILFGLLVLMSVQVTVGETTLLEGALFRLTSPVVRLFSGGAAGVRGLWTDYIDLRGARHENRELAGEVQQLRLEASRFEEVLRENDRLRELLDLRARIDYPSRVARIIANESLGPQRTLLVSLGSSDGINLDMPVVAPHGVVGRVIALAPHTAKVQLITDAGSGTAVTVARTRLQGLVSGRGGDTLLLRYIPKLEDVRPGDRLVTSGLDRIYPAGFPLGTVLRVAAGSGPMKVIEVFPAVDASRLEEVRLLEVEGHPLSPELGSAEGGDGEASAAAEVP